MIFTDAALIDMDLPLAATLDVECLFSLGRWEFFEHSLLPALEVSSLS